MMTFALVMLVVLLCWEFTSAMYNELLGIGLVKAFEIMLLVYILLPYAN